MAKQGLRIAGATKFDFLCVGCNVQPDCNESDKGCLVMKAKKGELSIIERYRATPDYIEKILDTPTRLIEVSI